jgi:hypothetical protein
MDRVNGCLTTPVTLIDDENATPEKIRRMNKKHAIATVFFIDPPFCHFSCLYAALLFISHDGMRWR